MYKKPGSEPPTLDQPWQMLSLGQVPTSSVWGWNSSRILSAVLHTPSWLAKKNYLGKDLLAYNSDPRKYSGINTIANPSETQSLLRLIKTKQNNLKTKAQQTNRKQPGHQTLDPVSQEHKALRVVMATPAAAIRASESKRPAAREPRPGCRGPSTSFLSQMLARKVKEGWKDVYSLPFSVWYSQKNVF